MSKEEGLGLLACAIENGCDVGAYRLGLTLHFEFYTDGNTLGEYDVKPHSKASRLQVVHISDLHLRPENDLELLKKLTNQHKSNLDHKDLTSFFTNKPEFVNELAIVLRCKDTVPADIMILVMLALAV
ncbi:hypothetical protein AXG93_1976s1030 [Marchantia polymorpha subsp. ruderalis]|uniref:Uncharacterized protein n=1 Tax=Marchantia polymorpha subsp. ruderalis TaxID=1480154 RepID=A0A176VDG0_MARPO|nr:hypothetical protein AXG93_1976s1030 [Marchantia polymorpha subsp. ruderalis]